jgi:hypothetical protein
MQRPYLRRVLQGAHQLQPAKHVHRLYIHVTQVSHDVLRRGMVIVSKGIPVIGQVLQLTKHRLPVAPDCFTPSASSCRCFSCVIALSEAFRSMGPDGSQMSAVTGIFRQSQVSWLHLPSTWNVSCSARGSSNSVVS